MQLFIVGSLFVLITACAHNPVKDFDGVKVGMDKTDVIDEAGTPQGTMRYNGNDIWIYRFHSGDKWEEREVEFKDGFAIYTGAPRSELRKKEREAAMVGQSRPSKKALRERIKQEVEKAKANGESVDE